MKNLKKMLLLSSVSLACQSALAVDAPAGLVPPGLAAGDTFYIVFASSYTLDGNKSSAVYAGAAAIAAANGVDTAKITGWVTLFGHDDSTLSTMSAFSTTDRPIYNTNGDKVADDRTKFYSNSLDNPIGYDEQGAVAPAIIWTGFNYTGTSTGVGDDSLGGNDSLNDGCLAGMSSATDRNWATSMLAGGNGCAGANLGLYVLSPLLTVPGDSDGSVSASPSVREPVGIPITADTVAEAVDVFDFTISDGGTSDGSPLNVSAITVHVSGTTSNADRAKISWRLDGPDATQIAGTYDAHTHTLTFTGLHISVADGGDETYTLNAYFNDNTGLTENQTVILSTDGDTDFTTSGTAMGATTPVTNGAGSKVEFEAAPTAPAVPAPELSESHITLEIGETQQVLITGEASAYYVGYVGGTSAATAVVDGEALDVTGIQEGRAILRVGQRGAPSYSDLIVVVVARAEDPAPELPLLNVGGVSDSEAAFRGGVSIDDGENYSRDGVYSVGESLTIRFLVSPLSEHVGKQARIVVAALVDSDPGAVYLLNESGALSLYDGETVAGFSELTLEEDTLVNLTPGGPILLTEGLVNGFEILIGYQLLETGELFYQTQGLLIEVTN